jgi:hypothetical protein
MRNGSEYAMRIICPETRRTLYYPAPPAALKGGAMESATTGHDAIDGSSVHHWRVSQLRRLGMPGPLAEIYADRINWLQLSRHVAPFWHTHRGQKSETFSPGEPGTLASLRSGSRPEPQPASRPSREAL